MLIVDSGTKMMKSYPKHSTKKRKKVKLVRCKEITKADQTRRARSDSQWSLPLLDMFPLTKCKATSKLPQQTNDKENSFLYVDGTKMYKEDRLFGPVYHISKGDEPYNSEEKADFKI